MKAKKQFSVLALTASVLLTGCSLTPDTNATVSKTGFFLDTVVSLTLYGTKEEAPINECFLLLETYESLLSRTKEGSDVWKINHSNGSPVVVSDETAQLIQTALDYSVRSDGAFDITIAPLSDLWDFKNNTGTVPDDAAIQQAKSHIGYENVRVDGNTVQLLDPEAAIDLGGIAKGYIADQLKAYLKEQNVSHALINLGGNVLALGGKPDGSDYNIGIQKPFAQNGEAITSVKIKDQSVVSSGIYERYFKVDDKIYHHILDPKTGYPYKNNLLGVSIVCDSSTEADALSTTCFAMGLDDGLKYIEGIKGAEALFITDDYEIHYSSGFPK